MRKLEPKKEAFSYQYNAIDKIKSLEYAAVFHEQGLGKTKIAIDVMLYWLASGDLDAVIVVAKKGLVPNWLSEFKDHTYLKPSVLGSNSVENYYTLNSSFPVIIAHYEAIRKEKKRIRLFCEAQRVGIILDEAHKIKNPDAAVSKAFHELRACFRKRLILTGTPAANRPYDMWSQIYFLDGGNSLGTDFDKFKRSTDIDYVADGGEKINYENSLSSIGKNIREFAVRETKNNGVIELPGKTFFQIDADWENLQREKYIQARDDLSLVVVREGIPLEDSSAPLLKRLLRLVQLASNPSLVDESYVAVPGKVLALRDLVAHVIDRGEKVIVWSSFNGNMEFLKNQLSEYGCRTVYGKMGIDDRYLSLEAFKERKDVRVLIATPGAAKEGLTLTVANNVIFYDRTFSLDDYLQAQDRIHRISQVRECNVYNIMIPGSIDEWVEELIVAKMMAAKFSQGDIAATEFRERMRYTFRESLKEVLGLDD